MTRATAKPRATKTRRAAEPAGLSPETIRTAALELIDREGLAEFSTRKLGRVLGCEAMAIYWYFTSKDALLDAVVDKLMESVAAVVVDRDDDDWLAVLRDVAHAYRNVARSHPNAFPLLATRRFSSAGTYAFLEKLFELAHRQNIDDRVVARFYRVVSSYCSGFALNELATLQRADSSGAKLTALRERFERVAAVSAWLEPRHLDEMFSFGLELQLAALATTKAPTARARRR